MERNSDLSESDQEARAAILAGVLAACPLPPTSILEVGANIGRNLLAFRRCTDARLYAVEPFAAARARMTELLGAELTESVCAPAQSLPFADSSIDFVFTSGVLIHIDPADLVKAVKEIVRVSKRYVWCNEYFAKQPESLAYRGQPRILFKRDFGKFYRELFPALKPLAQGFCWSETSPYDDTTWWLFEKPPV